MKYYGIDHGEARCGISSANEIIKIPSPIATVKPDELIQYFKNLHITKEDIIVFGLPVSMSGRYSTQTYKAVVAALELREALNHDIYMVDERLTSAALFTETKGSVNSKKVKQTKDETSSVLILQKYLSNSDNGILLCEKEITENEIIDDIDNLEEATILIENTIIDKINGTPIEQIKFKKFDLLVTDPWIFAYYFKKGLTSTSLETDIDDEYDIIFEE